MTIASLALMSELTASEAFRETIKSFVAEEMSESLKDLRGAVRVGDFHRAALIEGELGYLDDLLSRFDKTARKFNPNRS